MALLKMESSSLVARTKIPYALDAKSADSKLRDPVPNLMRQSTIASNFLDISSFKENLASIYGNELR